MVTIRRACAACAAAAGLAATVGFVVAAAGTPGLQVRGSVSQLGCGGGAVARCLPVAVFAVVVAVGLLALAVARVNPSATVALAATGVLGTVSATVVLSYDEKTQVQALQRTQPLLPVDFGKTEKRDTAPSC